MAAVDAELRPHDLLTPRAFEDLIVEDPPAWLREDPSVAAMVVVRRAEMRDARVPVGVRGKGRNRRCAAHLPLAAITRIVTPEMLARQSAWKTAPRLGEVPHFAILDYVSRYLDEAGMAWGPTGSMGFELASGVACLTEASDIDLVARAPVALSRRLAADLHESLRRLPVRVDVQIETPAGAMALAEYAANLVRVALRTPSGPRLVENPWQENP
jgi:phosphoribosyl-dephospho-CoA transferase